MGVQQGEGVYLRSTYEYKATGRLGLITRVTKGRIASLGLSNQALEGSKTGQERQLKNDFYVEGELFYPVYGTSYYWIKWACVNPWACITSLLKPVGTNHPKLVRKELHLAMIMNIVPNWCIFLPTCGVGVQPFGSFWFNLACSISGEKIG